MCLQSVAIPDLTNIYIKRTHNLDFAKAKAMVEELAKGLQHSLAASYQWDGNSLRFKRRGASGSIDVGERSVEVQVELGVVLVPVKGKIESAIHEGFNRVLDEAGDNRPA